MQPYQISAFHIRSGFLTKIHHTSWDSRASKFKKKKKRDVKEPAGCDDDMYLKGKKKVLLQVSIINKPHKCVFNLQRYYSEEC